MHDAADLARIFYMLVTLQNVGLTWKVWACLGMIFPSFSYKDNSENLQYEMLNSNCTGNGKGWFRLD